MEKDDEGFIDSYPEFPTAPEGGWDIRREGRSCSGEEMVLRREIRPEKFEVHQGRLFWCVEHRLAVLGLMLESLGIDAAVRLGDPKVWREAIDAIDRSREADGHVFPNGSIVTVNRRVGVVIRSGADLSEGAGGDLEDHTGVWFGDVDEGVLVVVTIPTEYLDPGPTPRFEH